MTGIDQRLHDLATRVPAPEVPVADDLARGRRRVRRTRLAAAGAALATLAVIGGAAGAAPALLGADHGPRYAGRSGTPSPATGSAAPSAPHEVEITPSRAPRQDRHLIPPPPSTSGKTSRTLAAWQRVLAEHLDPRWQHLVRYDARTNGNEQSGTSGGVVTSLGSKYGWQNAGEQGLGMLQVSVNADWSGLYWECGAAGAGWSCHDATGPDGEKARVAEHDGVLDVAVEHADGTVVVLTADSLFGNNSTVAVSGVGLTEKGLLRAASDERLTLPGGVPHIPPPLSARKIESVGRTGLLAEGEDLSGVEAYGGTDASVRGRWLVGGQDRGALRWEAIARVGKAPSGTDCLANQFTRCVLRTVDGQQLFVGYVRPDQGGGWQVQRSGPEYTVLVAFTPTDAAARGTAQLPDRPCLHARHRRPAAAAGVVAPARAPWGATRATRSPRSSARRHNGRHHVRPGSRRSDDHLPARAAGQPAPRRHRRGDPRPPGGDRRRRDRARARPPSCPRSASSSAAASTGMIGHTQPRRIAARIVAERIAEELGTDAGRRWSATRSASPTARPATTLRQADDRRHPAGRDCSATGCLAQYDTIIIDEAHERSLNIDFLLGYLRQLLPRRPGPEGDHHLGHHRPGAVRRHFADRRRDTGADRRGLRPHLSGRGPLPARWSSCPSPTRRARPTSATRSRRSATPSRSSSAEGPGDILVFLSGEREIRDTADALRDRTATTRGGGRRGPAALRPALGGRAAPRLPAAHRTPRSCWPPTSPRPR